MLETISLDNEMVSENYPTILKEQYFTKANFMMVVSTEKAIKLFKTGIYIQDFIQSTSFKDKENIDGETVQFIKVRFLKDINMVRVFLF